MSDTLKTLQCPSAQPDMPGARAFGVILGTVEAPQVAYLKPEAVVDLSRLKKLGVAHPTEVFRLAATCEGSRCAHFDGHHCTLGRRVAEMLPPVVESLPLCSVRPECRWYHEHGGEACLRCPQVITLAHRKGDMLAVATPPDPRRATGEIVAM